MCILLSLWNQLHSNCSLTKWSKMKVFSWIEKYISGLWGKFAAVVADLTRWSILILHGHLVILIKSRLKLQPILYTNSTFAFKTATQLNKTDICLSLPLKLILAQTCSQFLRIQLNVRHHTSCLWKINQNGFCLMKIVLSPFTCILLN